MYFKIALPLAKSTLDKVVPLFDYRYSTSLGTFSKEGKLLIKELKRNGASKSIRQGEELVSLIDAARVDWIEELVRLRDEYVHFSDLKEYSGFWLPGDRLEQSPISGVSDFKIPSIKLLQGPMGALDYLLRTRGRLLAFLREFLRLCGFGGDRRPHMFTQCESCRFQFADKTKSSAMTPGSFKFRGHVSVRVVKAGKDYGLIICPKCGEETETDLAVLRQNGYPFQ